MGGGTESELVLWESLEAAVDGEWTRLVCEQKVHRLTRMGGGGSGVIKDEIGPLIRVFKDGGVNGLKDLGFGDRGPHRWHLAEGGMLRVK